MSDLSPNALILKDILKPDNIIETHISYVFIKGDEVYKLKKSVDFGFLNFTESKYRRTYCYLEKELNSRFSRGIYTDVLKIIRREKSFALVNVENTMPTVDYVVKMKKIDNESFLSYKIEQKLIDNETAVNVGKSLATLFQEIKTDHESAKENCGYEIIKFNCAENFSQTEKYIGNIIDAENYKFIRKQVEDFLEKNSALFHRRLDNGFIKDGHGDLRMEHVYFEDDFIGMLDCIEFNKRFRYNDVVSDFVFLCTEVDYIGDTDLSDSFLDGFLQVYSDEDSRNLINFYKCYRAYVRGKVGCFMLDGKGEDWDGYENKLNEVKRFFDLSLSYAVNINEPICMISYGLMGSGKSKNSKKFSNKYAAKYTNTDVVRKLSANIDLKDKVYDAFGEGLYSITNTLNIYNIMGIMAEKAYSLRRFSIFDGSFCKNSYFETFLSNRKLNIKKCKFTASDDIIIQRLNDRKLKNNVSDGRPEIYFEQKNGFEDIGSDIEIATDGEVDTNIDRIIKFFMENG